MTLTVHTDGGARGNPGPAAVGVVIESGGKTIAQFGKTIGHATNNVAEYRAVVEALKYVTSHISRVTEMRFFLDSTLVVNQLMGRFKIKDPTLRGFLFDVRRLESEIGASVTYDVIRREQNARADALVNRALDEALMSSSS